MVPRGWIPLTMVILWLLHTVYLIDSCSPVVLCCRVYLQPFPCNGSIASSQKYSKETFNWCFSLCGILHKYNVTYCDFKSYSHCCFSDKLCPFSSLRVTVPSKDLDNSHLVSIVPSTRIYCNSKWNPSVPSLFLPLPLSSMLLIS